MQRLDNVGEKGPAWAGIFITGPKPLWLLPSRYVLPCIAQHAVPVLPAELALPAGPGLPVGPAEPVEVKSLISRYLSC